MYDVIGCGVSCALRLALAAPTAHSAEAQFIDVPADSTGPPLHGVVWSPCAAPAHEVKLGHSLVTPGIVACSEEGGHRPLIAVSHGYHGWYGSLHDVAETLADAGFVVAAINHPGDSGPDMSHADELSALIKRLIDFMLAGWPDHVKLDPGLIGVLGFSRGGYIALVLIGGDPDWHRLSALCPQQSWLPYCAQARSDLVPTEPPAHDTHIKAAVIADPAFGPLFTPDGLRRVAGPIQLWASVYSGDGSTLDGVSPANVAAINHDLSVPHEFHVVENAIHYAFLAPCRPLPNQTASDCASMRRASTAQSFTARSMTRCGRSSGRICMKGLNGSA